MDEVNSNIIDLQNLDVKIEDEDKVVLLIASLPPSYRHFKGIMLYVNYITLTVDNVKSNLLSKQKFHTEIHSKISGEGLMVRGRTQERGSSSKNQFRSKSRGKNSKYCHYCKKKGTRSLNVIKWKNKQDREDKSKGKQLEKSAEASIVETESDGDCFVAVGVYE